MRRIVFMLTSCIALAGVIPVASADSPALRIHPKFEFTGASTAEGTFNATGSAVAAGEICRRGHAFGEFAIVEADELGPRRVTATDTHTCADGSGSLTVLFEAEREKASGGNAHFGAVVCIVDGTGAYEGLRAVGTARAHLTPHAGRVVDEYVFAQLGGDGCPID